MKSNNFLLQHFLIESVKKYGEKTALVCDQLFFTYQQLYDDCCCFIVSLKEQGVVRGDRVMIQSGNRYLTVIAFFASIFCDAVPCIVDENVDYDTAKSIMASLSPTLVIVKNILDSKHKIYGNRSTVYSDALLSFSNTEQDIVMIMHTSGSTGIPKGVVLSHRNVISAICSINAYLKLKNSDVVFSILPLHFDYGLYQLLLCISVGATLILEDNSLLSHSIAHKIIKYKATVVPCVPSLVQLLNVAVKKTSACFDSVRMVTNTGENLSKNHIIKMRAMFPRADIFSMYGLTECKRCSYVPPQMLDQKMDSIGIPMPNLEMWIQDSKGNRLAAAIEGNLVISGPTVMQGYWRNNSETAKKIRLDANGKRILLTGDRAVMDQDGYFYFKGRVDAVIKFKGEKLVYAIYIKKINALEWVNRCHLFLHDNALIVCVETDDTYFDKNNFQLKIVSLFPVNQKPNHIYFFNDFPGLSNGKLNKRCLEKRAVDCISTIENCL